MIPRVRCSVRASARTKTHGRLCLPHTVAFFCAADVHEQKKPWVPLMLEATYRPTGWLGIMCVELSLPPAALLPYVCSCTLTQPIFSVHLHSWARRLGSRLYYEFKATALGDVVEWERLADSVAVEVRRHGAPPPELPAAGQSDDSGAALDAEPQDAASQLAVGPTPAGHGPVKQARRAQAQLAPAREGAAGLTVSVVHNNNNNINTNIGNTSTSIVLM